MPYTASHIANFMLEKAEHEGHGISPLKLLKLVYFGYGWGLAALDKKLFDEPIYAWAHGPVVRSVYDEFKHFGKQPIDCKSVDFDLETLKFFEPHIPKADKATEVILGKVWAVFKNFSAWSLREMTHETDFPWARVYREGIRNTVIPDDLIKEYFKSKIRQYIDDARDPTGAHTPPPQQQPQADAALFKDIKGTSAKKLTNSVEKVDGLSAEEEQAQERGGNLALRGTRRKVMRWAYYAAFVLGVVICVLAVVLISALALIYVYTVTKEGKIEDVMSSILSFVLGIAITLAIEYLCARKEKRS